jgi:hypothetical protein
MNENQFWSLIETSHHQANSDDEAQLELIREALSQLEPEEIVAFQRWFNHFHRVSYRADLWGAAYIMNGGASDDGFDYFRGWLIAQGRKVFEAALENPDSLAEVISEDAEADFEFELEEMLYVAREPWVEKTGLEMDAFYEALKPFDPLPELGEFEWGDGEGDIDERKGKKLYPKLWAKFGY